MERRTEIAYPDGKTKTIIEKEGFIVRDVIFGGIGALCGVGGSIVTWNYIGKMIPVGTKPVEKASRVFAQAVGSIVAEEIISDSVTKSLTETSDFVEGVYNKINGRVSAEVEAVKEKEAEKSEEVKKK